MVFGVPAPPPDVRVAFAAVPDTLVHELAKALRSKLVEPLPDPPQKMVESMGPNDVLEAPRLVVKIDVPGHAPIHAVIHRYGQTSMLATWIHRMTVELGTGKSGGAVQAVSLYLTGVDRVSDSCAIDAARKMRSATGKLLPVTPDVFNKLMNENKPLAVQIFTQSLARADPSIHCGFLALATAFFGMLGIEGVEPGPAPGGAPS